MPVICSSVCNLMGGLHRALEHAHEEAAAKVHMHTPNPMHTAPQSAAPTHTCRPMHTSHCSPLAEGGYSVSIQAEMAALGFSPETI